jgi:glycosyltransferase involved in cell wall biosynthesis
MIEVEKQGHDVLLYPLICQEQPILHSEAKKWKDRANCIPYLSLPIIKENLLTFLRSPLKYIDLITKIIWENRSSIDFLAKGLLLFPKSVYIAKHMKLNGVEHVHAHYATHPALAAWVIHELTGLSYSITIHSHDIYDCHAMLGTKLKSATFLAPISKYNIKYLSELLGTWVAEKCHVVHCGIKPSNYTPMQDHHSTSEPFQILQIGSLHWKKGQTSLIEAMGILKKEGIKFQLKIIGEGAERGNIEKAIKEQGVEEYVSLLGAKTEEEVAELLPVADCYIQSSVSEGIPVAIMEAMACGLPVVATNITGIPELVLDGKTGILVESKDVNGMARALLSLYENPELRREMGKQGREWVLEDFTLDGNVKKLSELFSTHKC